MERLALPRRVLQAKKIWEIEPCYKCSLIGACLTRTELRTLAKERIFAIESGYDDYQLHAEFIRISDRADAQGKALHKYLAKKYQGRARKYLRAGTDQEIRALWDKDMAEGLLDSAWWSVLIHPSASIYLVGRLYGSLHMLGHDALNNHHKDRQQGDRLRAKITMLEEVLGSERQHYRQEKRQQQEEIAALQQTIVQQKAMEQENGALRGETARLQRELQEMRDGKGYAAQQQEIDDLRQTNNGLCGRIDELTGELAAMKEQMATTVRQLEDMERLRRRLEHHEAEQTREIATLESLLMRHIVQEAPCCQCADQHTANCPGLSLCGKTVLYVGGLNNMIPHYRQLVEQFGGRFLHHDGGKEASRTLLPKMLTTADAVLCPIDCVSHDACNCVKKMCKRYQKPFVLMRSAGLSSLAKGLSEIVQ
ncbi:DUF2325 domain-containing protein [Desulfobulbus elongatus]|uniref:DUF2325 domain-containing protein n=1 Tax=Desulfobulbus elongatus TaxID=53332 RepID=UPI0004881174|nr:DUF2325 domain-containing protein [Desulfobulbus elongatus]